MSNDIAKQIKYYRKKEKYSQTELAEKLHVTRQAISNWERELSETDIATIQYMANLFHISVQELIEGSEEDKHLRKQLKQILILFCICIALFVLSCVCIWSEKASFISLIGNGIMLIMSTTLVLTFSSSIQNQDYTMIAGYDDSLSYNKPIINKILIQILLQILIMHLFLNMITLFFIWIHQVKLINITMYIYLINFFASMFLTNVKYRKQLFTEEPERKKIRKGGYYVLYFVIHICLLIIGAITTFSIHKLHNNTPEALIVLAFMLPIVLYQVILSFVTDTRLKNDEPITIWWFVLGSVISIILIILMLVFPY